MSERLTPEQLAALYRHRHGHENAGFRDAVWEVLCSRVFQQWVPTDGTVVDVGAGRGEFTRAIRARRRIAVDLNPDLPQFVGDAEVVLASALDLSPIPDGEADAVFSSNLLEHLPSPEDVVRALRDAHRVLRPGGRVIILMPNIAAVGGRFWDYLDHLTPLTDRSLAEALILAGFEVERVTARFVPYAVNRRSVPKSTLALRVYLSLPFVWRFFGAQMLAVGRKAG